MKSSTRWFGVAALVFLTLAQQAAALDIIGTWRVVYQFTFGRGTIRLIDVDDPDPITRPLLWVRFAEDGTGEFATKGRAPLRMFWEIVPADDPYGDPEHVFVNVQGSGNDHFFFTDLPDGRRMWTLLQRSISENGRGMPIPVYAVVERAP